MKLKAILEVQRKMPTTNMDRSNVTGAYGVASVNDFFHLVHDGEGHGQKSSSSQAHSSNKQVESPTK